VLGTPARIRVLTTSIVESQAIYPPRTGLGASLSVTLLALALVGLWMQRRVLGRRSSTTVAGKGSHPRRFQLGFLRWIVLGLCFAYLLLAVILPYGAILLSALRTNWTPRFTLDQLTLEHFRWVLFDYPITQRAFVNSLFLATVGATVTMLLCALISFLSMRTRLPGRKVLDYLAMLPMGFPGVVLAFGLLQAWIYPPFVLYGTIWILFVAYMTRYIPIGVRSTSATLIQIHPQLEEASLSSGANWFQTFKNVVLPLLKPGLFAGWVLLFIAFSRELSASIMLYSPRLEVLSVAIYDLMQSGNYRALSALAFLQVGMALGMLAIAKWLIGLDRVTSK
jgi:iron(III) transport system permease protein